jgi:hypothetical protein
MLRDLFWLALVCAMGLGWWLTALDCARLLEENQRRAEAQQKANATLAIGWLQNHASEGVWSGVEITNEPPKEVAP